MQATTPIPGDSWPAGMTITIKNDITALLELLWVREAWGLAPAGDVPPPLLNTPVLLPVDPYEASWQTEWTPLWKECVQHAGHSDTWPIQQFHDSPARSPERAALLTALVGPSWRVRFGDAALGEPFATWQQQCLDEINRTNAVPLDESPERAALSALTAAWEAGLTTVVSIPCAGEYNRFISPSALLVTENTRHDSDRYATALSDFSNQAGRSL